MINRFLEIGFEIVQSDKYFGLSTIEYTYELYHLKIFNKYVKDVKSKSNYIVTEYLLTLKGTPIFRFPDCEEYKELMNSEFNRIFKFELRDKKLSGLLN